MAYVPGTKNDIFISYAHVDNERDSHDVRWVSEFVRGFTVELRQRLGAPKDFALFFDQSDLEAHHRLDYLLENARQSAILVAVLSPSYISHDWTIKELREFATIASDRQRIIVIEKLPLETYDEYPPEIEQHKRTQFWRTNEPESHTPSTLTVYGRPVEYRSRLETLADQVQRLLRELRRGAEQAQASAQVKSEPAPVVSTAPRRADPPAPKDETPLPPPSPMPHPMEPRKRTNCRPLPRRQSPRPKPRRRPKPRQRQSLRQRGRRHPSRRRHRFRRKAARGDR